MAAKQTKKATKTLTATKKTRKKNSANVVETMSTKFRNTAVRFTKARARIVAWKLDDDQLLKLIEKAEGIINGIVERLEKVPYDWVPARGTTQGVVFTPGSKVQLSEKLSAKLVKRYENSNLTQETELEVLENDGSRIIFRDPKDVKWSVPRSHVQKISA